MTIVHSCSYFVSISRGLMAKPVGFLRVPPLKFVEQIVWFFSFLISLLFGPFFFIYICVWFYLLQSNCNNGNFSRTSFVKKFLKVNIFLSILENFSNLNNKSTAMHLVDCHLDKVRLWGFSQNFSTTILYFEKSWLWICSFLWMNLIFKDLPFLHAKRMKIVQFTYCNLLVHPAKAVLVSTQEIESLVFVLNSVEIKLNLLIASLTE